MKGRWKGCEKFKFEIVRPVDLFCTTGDFKNAGHMRTAIYGMVLFPKCWLSCCN